MYSIEGRFLLYRELNPDELTQKQFNMILDELKNPQRNVMSDELVDFLVFADGYPSRQQSFVDYVSKRIQPGAKILEVGCGRTGIASRKLAEKGYTMTAMDPKVEITDSKVNFQRKKFDYRKARLDEFDYVVALEPCDATEHIIRACLAQNVPFILFVCGEQHRLISGKMPKDVYDWYDELIKIAPDKLKFRYVNFHKLLDNMPMISSTF